jgi:hypothetical protein
MTDVGPPFVYQRVFFNDYVTLILLFQIKLIKSVLHSRIETINNSNYKLSRGWSPSTVCMYISLYLSKTDLEHQLIPAKKVRYVNLEGV